MMGYIARTLAAKKAAAVLLAIASLIMGPAGADEVRTAEQPLLGEAQQASDCSGAQRKFNQDILQHGRSAAVTDAFRQALRQGVKDDYRKCQGDPHYNKSQSTQISKVLAVTVSPNDLQINCSGGTGNASTSIGSYDKPDEEEFWWGGWFSAVHSQLGKPVCGSDENPNDDNCRFEGYPWPYSQASGIVWHEVMHQRGYGHGANSQGPAKPACGYSGDASWHFQRNTMPYIVGNRMTRVIERSAERCSGGLRSCPGENELKLLDSFDGSTCSCVRDPGQKGIGILGRRSGELVDVGIHPVGNRIGGWRYAADNEVAATGDFNGDGREDFVVRSGWGLGLLHHEGRRWRQLMIAPNGTKFGGWRFNEETEIAAIGDFDGDGRDDLVVRSDWGLGILSYGGDTLRPLMMKPKDTWFGDWRWDASVNEGSDTIEGAGDFDGDGAAELLVTSSWGVGVLALDGDSMDSVLAKEHGTRFGGWRFNRDTRVAGLADFDGDGADDLVVRSGWGLGILSYGGSTLRPLMMKSKDTWFGDWRWDASVNEGSDTIEALADFNGDDAAELLVTSSWGIGVLGLDGNSMDSVVAKEQGTRFGGWLFTKDTLLQGYGDVTGTGGADIVVQSNWGLGVLTMSGSGLRAAHMKPHGQLFGSWLAEKGDRVVQVGDFSPGTGEEVLIRAPR